MQLICTITIILEARAIPMHNQPYYMTPNNIPYLAMFPNNALPPTAPTFIFPHHYTSTTFYLSPQQMDLAYVPNVFGNTMFDFQHNIYENQICSGFHSETYSYSEPRTPVAAEHVVASSIEESSKILQKQENISLQNRIQNPTELIKVEAKSNPKESPSEDYDYNPLPEKRKKASQKSHQNQNRNIIPNLISQIFSFIQRRNKSGQIAEKLLGKYPHSPQFSLKRYYQYQSLLKTKLNHYSNEKSLRLVNELYEPKCENWPQEQQRHYNKICRMVIHHFLHEDSVFIILTSRRMNRENKAAHMRARRQVAQSVLTILKGN